jgi:hypothetical protein
MNRQRGPPASTPVSEIWLTRPFNHYFKEKSMMKVEQTGTWTAPDPGGIVRRGEAVGFRSYVESFGEPPACFAGSHRDGIYCERPAVMEVYGIAMCEAHGEEAAAGALEEIAHDLEQELQRPMHPHLRGPSPHIEAAVRRGFDVLPDEANDHERADGLLLAAFPLDRARADGESVAYAEDPDANGHWTREPPFEMFMSARLLLHRHMRLAFEEDATWLVETLEKERAEVAAQAAYALALEREAGLRPEPAGEEAADA